MLQSSDHERQLIAYEIHDGLAQYVTGAIMQLQMSDHLREQDPVAAKKAFDAGMVMVRESLSEARRLISGVRPPILDESGVVAALAHLVYDFQEQKGLKVEFHSEVDFGRLAPVLENAVYRIVQEGLTNACKHSTSKRIRVGLVQHGGQLRIEIQDWGRGFVVENVAEGRFGLEGIRELRPIARRQCRDPQHSGHRNPNHRGVARHAKAGKLRERQSTGIHAAQNNPSKGLSAGCLVPSACFPSGEFQPRSKRGKRGGLGGDE